MAIKHYKKEIAESPVWVLGHPMRFDLLETQDPTLIAELDKCVARGIGGVMLITPDEYSEEVKKKELWSQSGNNLKPQQRQELSALRLDARRVVEAVGNPAPRVGMFAKPQVPTDDRNRINGNGQPMPEPIEVPTPESFVVKQPPTMKMSEAKNSKAPKA